jgi:hypothetical protein
MAYKVVRVKLTNVLTSKFKEAEDDLDFKSEVYPELDEFLSVIETRGWTVVSTAVVGASGVEQYLYVTVHQPDPDPAPPPA